MFNIDILSGMLAFFILWAVTKGANQVSVSPFNTCVLTGTNVSCWGQGNSVLGKGNTDHLLVPPSSPIDLGDNFETEMIDCGYLHCCGVSLNKTLKCWGSNTYGQLGQGDTNDRGDDPDEMGDSLAEIDLGFEFAVDDVSCGAFYTCALSTNNEIKCFGADDQGQLGYGNTSTIGNDENKMGDVLPALNLGDDFLAIQIKCGYAHSCAISAHFRVKCWGWNSYGQLGQGDTENRGDNMNEMGDNLTPIDFGANFNVSRIRCASIHNCALSTDHEVKCWGSSEYGRLGLGGTDNRGDGSGEMGDDLPVLDFGSDFVLQIIGGGGSHNLVVSINGSLKAWARNQHGQLGYGDLTDRGDATNQMGDFLPSIDLGSGYTVIGISTSYHGGHSCALLENGTDFLGLKCWGWNGYGQLGLGDTANRGDEPNEMGVELQFISLTFPPLPTMEPTSPTIEPTNAPTMDPSIEPTSDPTTKPTSDPTVIPTTEPTVKPTIYPTIFPTADPTARPTYAPTVSPTMEPTSKCKPYRNCTECTNFNSDSYPQCFWHIPGQTCYHYNELNEDQKYVFEEEKCTNSTTPSPTAPAELSGSSTNALDTGLFQWILIVVAVVIICIMASVVLFLLWRRKSRDKMDAGHGKQTSAVLEMVADPQHVVRDESIEIQPGNMYKPELKHYLTPSLPSAPSRGEGIEGGDENQTVTNYDADV